jgi:hypothetical protein
LIRGQRGPQPGTIVAARVVEGQGPEKGLIKPPRRQELGSWSLPWITADQATAGGPISIRLGLPLGSPFFPFKDHPPL